MTSTTSSSSATSTPTDTSNFIHYLGRVNPSTKELTWPGTGVAFTFTGTSATIQIAQISGANSVELTIDSNDPIIIANVADTSITTPTGLSHGTHTVLLRKRSEAQYGSLFLGAITTDGNFLRYTPATRQIDIIGDSISVGYGLDGTFPCTNTAALENNPATYGALAAKSLGAEYSAIAWSGKGLVRNIATGDVDTSPTMPELYTRYGANDADNSYPFATNNNTGTVAWSWTPDAVVIALGTNDFSYLAYDSSGQAYSARDPIDAATFTAGMVAFVRAIRAHYAAAEVFLVGSPMLSDTWPTAGDAQHSTLSAALQDAVEGIGAGAHFVEWATQGAEVGCDYHPNAATNEAQAVVLEGVLRAVLGW
ncbi:hypothetical protein BJX64DRAFT_289128 [Aspergillus heterothallicus]